jgi:hypothetical protein
VALIAQRDMTPVQKKRDGDALPDRNSERIKMPSRFCRFIEQFAPGVHTLGPSRACSLGGGIPRLHHDKSTEGNHQAIRMDTMTHLLYISMEGFRL